MWIFNTQYLTFGEAGSVSCGAEVVIGDENVKPPAGDCGLWLPLDDTSLLILLLGVCAATAGALLPEITEAPKLNAGSDTAGSVNWVGRLGTST